MVSSNSKLVSVAQRCQNDRDIAPTLSLLVEGRSHTIRAAADRRTSGGSHALPTIVSKLSQMSCTTRYVLHQPTSHLVPVELVLLGVLLRVRV